MAAASPTVSVALFGDSYVKDGSSETYPMQLAKKVGGVAHNFAKMGAQSDGLAKQVEEFKAYNGGQRVDAAIIHVGGNDCCQDLKKTMAEDGSNDIADIVCQNLKAAIKSLVGMGVGFHVVSSVPFTSKVPFIRNLIEQSAHAMGRDFEAENALAIKQEQALNQKIYGTIQHLREEFPQIRIIHFQEVEELQKWTVEEDLFGEDGFHPSHEGHGRLQKALLDLWNDQGFPKGSAEGLLSASGNGGAPSTPQEIERRPADDASEESLDKQFDNACRHVEINNQFISAPDLLRFYGLFKQATVGDIVHTKMNPLTMSAAKIAKVQAWKNLRGTSKDAAQTEYIAKINGIMAAEPNCKRVCH